MPEPPKCLVNVVHFEHPDSSYLDNGFLQNCLGACLILTYSTDITNTALIQGPQSQNFEYRNALFGLMIYNKNVDKLL
jgi:hypothetical protein